MQALRMIKRVEQAGDIHLRSLPLPEGQEVEVIVRPIVDDMSDLAQASESGLAFWENEIDDQVWNDALPPA